MHAMTLPEPTSDEGRAGLAALLAEPARALVALDFDGTLSPIVVDPDAARPAPGAVEVLRAVGARVGTLAVLTGRAAPFIADLPGMGAVPGLRVLGHYGLQQWYDGELHSPAPDPAVDEVRRRLAAVLADAPPGVHVEDKTHSLVVHTRPAADPAGALADLTPRLERLAREVGLEAVPGRYLVEIRPDGVDKGTALAALARDRTARSVVFVGDDIGDLAAFAAIDVLRADGVPGVKVASVDPGHDDQPDQLAAVADLVLGGPAAMVDFLSELAARTRPA
jgi:trehalose 6-phosphate phosphatase